MELREELLTAIQQADLATVERLIAMDRSLVNSQDAQGISAVMVSVYYGKPEITSLLLKKRPRLNLYDACAIGKVDRVKSILKRKPKLLNEFAPEGFQPLGLALK
jgi:ankyrin repeat protein